MSESRAWDIALAPSRAHRRLAALACAGCWIVALALLWAGARPPGMRVPACAAAGLCAIAGLLAARGASGQHRARQLRLLGSEAGLPVARREARLGLRRRRGAGPDEAADEMVLLGPRAVYVSASRIVLRSRTGGAVIWRDAAQPDTFRRLAALARWSAGGRCL